MHMSQTVSGSSETSRHSAEWIAILETLLAERQVSPTADVSAQQSPEDGPLERMRRNDFPQQSSINEGPLHEMESEHSGEDDLDRDLAKAALQTGEAAFEARRWEDAGALLQEALQILQQLPLAQRAFCDLFALRHQLALCSYHTQGPADSESALLSLMQQPANSAAHREYVYSASHHLALLYIRTGRLEDARVECEKALQGRRRLLGKSSEPALQSTALIAHVYGLVGNRARATACLAMIPETRRSEIVSDIQTSLGDTSEYTRRSSVSLSSTSDQVALPVRSVASDTDMSDRCFGPVSSDLSLPTISGPRPSYQRELSKEIVVERSSSLTVTSSSTPGSPTAASAPMTGITVHEQHPLDRAPETSRQSTTIRTSPSGAGLARVDILRNIRCAPSDRIEEAVCSGDGAMLESLLSKKRTGFWRSKVQKALHSKRVTALHFAALFGEVAIANALLGAGYDINEIPESSATRQSPLKFALGARQVEMVSFLTARGARPTAPDSWSTLAGLLMDRPWLSNTLSTDDREHLERVPNQIIAILRVWLAKGWDPNTPYNTSGRTLLHQVVAFESGFYKWDANLRGTITRFLCNEGADPTRIDTKGNSPYDMATVVEDQDVLLVFDQRLSMKELGRSLDGPLALDDLTKDPVELPAVPPSPVELPVTHKVGW